MHPRNIYATPPDFKQLAIDYPNFRNYAKVDLSGKIQFPFKNPEAVSELSKTLLLKDFNIHLELPPGKLIPTIPLRLNYILWIEDLLKTVKGSPILGVDIGTGASCIYPLLGSKKSWHFLATEVNANSVEIAKNNIEKNGLSDVITVQHVSESSLILKGVIDTSKKYHFSMCNPPFFKPAETPFQRTDHRQGPSNSPSGCQDELSVDGGEVKFVTKMIDDSVELGDKILIYTTMVGKRSSLKVLKDKVSSCNVKSMVTTSFVQGKTTRWGLAWSFVVDLPAHDFSPKKKKVEKKFVPFVFELPEDTKFAYAKERINELLAELEMETSQASGSPLTWDVKARRISWRNQRRKRREKQRNEGQPEAEQGDDDEPPPKKKTKMEDQNLEEETTPPVTPVLEFKVLLLETEGKVSIEISFIGGECGKNGVYEVIQYLKNHWAKKS